MTYSDKQMREMEGDPVRLRAYFWRVATNCRQMAAVRRNRAQRGFEAEPGDIKPEMLEKLADTIMSELDTIASNLCQQTPGA